jgi:hypothetical protein
VRCRAMRYWEAHHRSRPIEQSQHHHSTTRDSGGGWAGLG